MAKREISTSDNMCRRAPHTSGVDPGGGGVFWGTPKLHKEGKNVARVHVKTPHFST